MEASPGAAPDRTKQRFSGNRQAPGALGDVMFKSSKVPQAKKAAISNNWLFLWQNKANFDPFLEIEAR